MTEQTEVYNEADDVASDFYSSPLVIEKRAAAARKAVAVCWNVVLLSISPMVRGLHSFTFQLKP